MRINRAVVSAAVAVALGGASQAAQAINIDLGIEDLDTSLVVDMRYNVGIRTEARDSRIALNPLYDESNYRFDKGDIVTNRLDLTPQFQMDYDAGWGALQNIGLRVTGNLFKDLAYDDDHVACRPGTTSVGLPQGLLGPNSGAVPLPGQGVSYCDSRVVSYRDGKYNKHSRDLAFDNAELLEAFAFASFQFGEVPVNIKVGPHALFWGETLFSPFVGVSYAQGAVDLNKALAVPGATLQDLFRPVNQVSGAITFSDSVFFGFQYFLDWEGLVTPEAGTYLNPIDPFLEGSEQLYLATLPVVGPYTLKRERPLEGENKNKFGLQAKFNVTFPIDATYGLYYRKFDETLPWVNPRPASPENQPLLISALGSVLQLLSNAGVDLATIPTLPGSYRMVYPRDTELYGLSVSTEQFGLSFGMDVAYSPNRSLLSNILYPDEAGQRARGQTWSGTFNTIYIGPEFSLFGIPLWDASFTALEVNWSYLQKVTENEQFYKRVGSDACKSDAALFGEPGTKGEIEDLCTNDYHVGAALLFQPTWYQVFPKIDMNATLFVQNQGIRGTSPINLAGFQDAILGSVGIGATYASRLNVALNYNFYDTTFKTEENLAGEEVISSFNFIGTLKDRDWVSLTVKYGF